MGHIASLGAAVGTWLLAGCNAYPPPEEVVGCAAGRLTTGHGAFSVEERPGSWFAIAEYAIVYQKHGSSDRAIVVYNRRNGPIAVHPEITYGNHAEIAGAVRAIELCAQPG